MNRQKGTRKVTVSLVFISFFALSVLIVCAAQQEDDLRRVWNKKFVEARQKNADAQLTKSSRPKPAKATSQVKTKAGAGQKAEPVKPSVSLPAEHLEGDLVGVTIWRLTEKSAQANKDTPRILIQQPNGRLGRLVAERVTAETVFSTNQRVRIGIEVPRGQNGYLYVIDREVYVDGTKSVPYLIFPSQTTPRGGNLVAAGKIVYVPAQGDPHPYFNIERSRKDQVSELLTIIVSPAPLDVQPGALNAPTELDPSLVARWEQEWGGRTERRELGGGAGKSWTAQEKQAGEGKRKLLQNDPLPQTVYFVFGKRGDHTLISVPLRIAP